MVTCTYYDNSVIIIRISVDDMLIAIPVPQSFPVQPATQVQVFGAIHLPLLMHGLLHTAIWTIIIKSSIYIAHTSDKTGKQVTPTYKVHSLTL